ncbi:MAG: hypothetical protein WD491_08545 [Balneolales bacterium]
MNFFGNYHLRAVIIALLLFGMAPALMPAKATSSAESVSVWLHGFAGESNLEQVMKKISHLDDLQDEPDLLLKKASEVISANAELFSLPGNNPEPTNEEVFKVLVQEWNRQQQTGSMGTAIVSERHSPALPFENIKYSDAFPASFLSADIESFSLTFETTVFETYRLHPLLSGTSINAP